MFGLTTTRRLRAELAAAKAETDRQRERAEQAEAGKATAEYNRAQLLRQLAEADAVNTGLRGRIQELGRRISRLTEADPDYAEALEKQLAAAREQLAKETRRADRLQLRLDDAVGLKPGRIEDSSSWQPGYEKPKPGVAS